MFNKIIKNQFTHKVVIVILIVSLIPILLYSVFFYVSSSAVVKENVRDSTLQISHQAADSLSYIFSVGSDMSDLIYSNEELQDIVKQDLTSESASLEWEKDNQYVTSFLNTHIYSSSFVRIIYILKEEGRSWGSGTFSEHKLAQYNLSEMNWVKKAKEQEGDLVWEGLQIDQLSGAGERTEFVLPISRTMKDFQTLNDIAYIQVFLDGSAILEKINQIKLGETGRFFVVDQQGKVMIDPITSKINKKIASENLYQAVINQNQVEFEYEEENVNFYGVKQNLSNGWMIVGVVPIHEITGGLTDIRNITWITFILLGILVVIIGVSVASRITKPVKVLTSQMKLVGEGNFKTRTTVETTDEIGMMSMQFNEMIQQVEQLMDQVKKEQEQKKEAEIRAVKHRINPHFLFNSLSTIRWLVKFKQFDRASSALLALTRLLEQNMGKKGTFVKVIEEIDFIEKYVELLQIRYDQTFHLKINLDEGTANFSIPQMLLQPIVENSIFHGIVPTSKEGTIVISGQTGLEGTIITIKDSGIGIKPERLQDIQHSSKTSIGIGLLHVFDSVSLYYSSDSKVELESGLDGTTVKLFLKPKHRGGTDV